MTYHFRSEEDYDRAMDEADHEPTGEVWEEQEDCPKCGVADALYLYQWADPEGSKRESGDCSTEGCDYQPGDPLPGETWEPCQRCDEQQAYKLQPEGRGYAGAVVPPSWQPCRKCNHYRGYLRSTILRRMRGDVRW